MPISPGINKNQNPSRQPQNSPVRVPAGNRGCDNNGSCDGPKDQIVFPKACGSTEANEKITEALKKAAVDDKVYISENKKCKGVFAWFVKMRVTQVPAIKKLPNVEAVVPDRPLKSRGSAKAADSDLNNSMETASATPETEEAGNGPSKASEYATVESPEASPAASEGNNSNENGNSLKGNETPKIASAQNDDTDLNEFPELNVRATPNTERDYPQDHAKLKKRRGAIQIDRGVTPNLSFISSPGLTGKHDYYYPGGPYRRIRIYSLEYGVQATHSEFTSPGEPSIIQKFLYSPNLKLDERTATDGDKENPWGTCALSVTCGRTMGVFKKPTAVVVKAPRTAGGFLAGFQEVLNDLILRPPTANIGYTIFVIHDLIDNDDAYTVARLKQLVNEIVNTHGVVLVSPAGYALGPDPKIGYPSAMSEDKSTSIIVAGSVDLANGEISSYTQPGPYITVGAPGTVDCASASGNSDTILLWGHAYAAASTAGVAALLLADPEIGNLLRTRTIGPARATKECIVELSRQKGAGILMSIWNGVDPTQPDHNYGWPPLSLKCLQEEEGSASAPFEDTNNEDRST